MLIHKKLSRGSSLSRDRLGNGPLRFAAMEKERGIKDQINALNPSERSCFDHLKQKWEKKYPNDMPFSNEMLLRFLRCSPGPEAFHERPAWKIMKAYPQRCHNLTAASLEHQLKTKTIFPIPFLRTGEGYEVCYIRPSRVIAKPAAVSMEVLDSIAYTLSTMMENEQPCTNGISVMFNMDGFGMSNFATDYWFNLMSMLQGKIVPLRVNNLFIVNPPKWFGNIWNVTKPMITLEFKAKVRMVNEEELAYYLKVGYEEFLPDEMETGQTSTHGLVEDYITYRKAMEASIQHSSSRHLNNNSKKNNVDSSTPNNTTSGGKAVRRNSLSSMNVAVVAASSAAVATFESFVPKNPARRRNSISSSSTCDSNEPTPPRAASVTSAAKSAQRRRNSIAVPFFGDYSITATTTARRRNSISSSSMCDSNELTPRAAAVTSAAKPAQRRRNSTAVPFFGDYSTTATTAGAAATTTGAAATKPFMQRRRNSLPSAATCCSSPITKNRRFVSAGILDSPNSKRRNDITAVYDSPTSPKKPLMQRRRSSLSSSSSHGSCSSPISNKPLMQRRRISLSSQGSCFSPIMKNQQTISARGILDSPNDSPNKRWSEISAVCDSPNMKRRSSIFSIVPVCGDSPPGTGQQEKQRNKLEQQNSFSSSFLDVPSLDMIRGNSKRSVVINDEKSTESMHRSTTTSTTREASFGSMRSGPSEMKATSERLCFI